MRFLLAALAALILPHAAFAQAPLACSPQNVGQRVCQAEGICECSYFAGGLMFRDAPGYRWDCSLTHGTCVGSADMPTLSRAVTPLPAAAARRAATGQSRDSVRFAQADLRRHGFDPGPVDGVVGRQTRTAIAAFQRAQSLPATGELDQATINRLRS